MGFLMRDVSGLNEGMANHNERRGMTYTEKKSHVSAFDSFNAS